MGCRSFKCSCIPTNTFVAEGRKDIGQTVDSALVICGPQGAGRKQVAAVMGVQTARSSTVARPFMRLKPQNIAVQVPLNPADAEVRVQSETFVAVQTLGFDGTL